MTQLTTAFLGTAHIHMGGFVQHLQARQNQIRVAAVYDPNAERGKSYAQTLGGAAWTDDPQSILADPNITSVIVCSETVHHKDLVVAAARAGKPIFCEKPLGLGRADAEAMAQAIRDAGVLFQTGFFMRGDPIHQFIKREVQAGHLGKLTRVRYANCHQAALDGWFDTDFRWLADPKQAGGGAMLDLGAHVLDILLHTYPHTEGDVVRAQGMFGNRGGRYGAEIDEYGAGLLQFQSGMIAEIEASWVDPKLRAPIEVHGTEGEIVAQNGTVTYYSKHVDGHAEPAVVSDLPPAAPHAFELFWDAILGQPLPIPLVSVDEAAQGSRVMEELYQSAGRSTTEGLASSSTN